MFMPSRLSTCDLCFLGAMVLEPQAEGYLLVFDGLQRSTALVVLFSVIRDLMPAGSVDIREALDACINIGKKLRIQANRRGTHADQYRILEPKRLDDDALDVFESKYSLEAPCIGKV